MKESWFVGRVVSLVVVSLRSIRYSIAVYAIEADLEATS
jgi:hypothetical protein